MGIEWIRTKCPYFINGITCMHVYVNGTMMSHFYSLFVDSCKMQVPRTLQRYGKAASLSNRL